MLNCGKINFILTEINWIFLHVLLGRAAPKKNEILVLGKNDTRQDNY